MINKKGNTAFGFFVFFILVFGFLISFKLKNTLISASIIFLFGFTFQQIINKIKDSYKIPLYLIMGFFLIGYLLGDKVLSSLTNVLLFLFGFSIILLKTTSKQLFILLFQKESKSDNKLPF